MKCPYSLARDCHGQLRGRESGPKREATRFPLLGALPGLADACPGAARPAEGEPALPVGTGPSQVVHVVVEDRRETPEAWAVAELAVALEDLFGQDSALPL